ncbi:uncharacterized protein LOC110176874 [Drosophila serrata]|uniref:uncharacterized protein LOC110176874 n=1 Tax=Drosophila serrata TaxID=7274 RepID=UPI000A1D118F|nr:uncharacterized protein LOC110176874 [Drosophila serrata]KAH8374482.1 hypothetical protein KR200_009033 [Drosophila serrata]
MLPDEWADKRILVKCGGFSSQLAKNVTEEVDGDPLWGSRFDATNPGAVVQTHLDFLRSGADIILTNTYQSSVEGFTKYLGLTEAEGIKLMETSVALAKKAKEQYLRATGVEESSTFPLVLGSIGPYGACLHDGSEYSGNYANRVTKDELKEWHKTRIWSCVSAGVYGLALETLPCQLEAEAVTEFVIDLCVKTTFWVSFQCKDESHLASGESFATAGLAIWRLVKSRKAEDRFLGIGVNCVNPQFVTPLLTSLIEAVGADERPPLVVYSNRGEIYDAELGEWTGTGEQVAKFVPEWLNLGVRIVGGCCRVYPADVLEIRKCVDSYKLDP